MEISLIQGILIGLITAFCYSGLLLGIYTNRALVMSFFVGVVLGDLQTALTFGALAELAYMGFGVGAGGTVPPNPVGPGIIGTIMVITLKQQGVTPESALALSFPFAVLFQLVTTAIYTIFSGNVKWSKNAIEQGKYKRFNLIANSTYLAFVVAGFLIGILAALSRPGLQAFVEALPNWLINGFSVAGGLIPAIGFAMILSVMLEKSLTPYVLLGYICAAYLELPTMAVAMMGTVFALIQYYGKDKTIVGEESIKENGQAALMEEEDFSNGI